VPELIDDGVTGILVEPGEPEKLSQAVKSLLADREKAAQMSKACLEKHFDSLGEYAEKLLKIYANKE
jgi:starch synthase